MSASSVPAGSLLERAVQNSAFVLYSGALRRGIFPVPLECNLDPKDGDVGIARRCDVVDGLVPSERRHWERALSRTVDVG